MRRIILEGSRDNLLLPYLELLNQRSNIGMSLSQFKQLLLAKFVNEANIRNLSLSSNYYLSGVAKYYFQGKLTSNKVLNVFDQRQPDVWNGEVCERLNALILILRNSYIDTVGTTFEQPEDFGNLTLEKLLRKYNKVINKALGINQPVVQQSTVQLDRTNTVGNGYTYEILYSYDDARKYNKATEPGAWCITYGQHHYDAYIRKLNIHYVIFAKNGYEKIPRKKGENWTYRKPQDEYGNSLIALLQSNKNGEPVYITSRWNHGVRQEGTSCEADHAYTKEEFFNVVGIDDSVLQNIFNIWKEDTKQQGPNKTELNAKKTTVLRAFKYAQMNINTGNFNPFGEDNRRVQFFTNTDMFSKAYLAAKNAYDETGDREERTKIVNNYNDFINKLSRKSVVYNRVNIDGTCYHYLTDNGNILFDTIVDNENEFYDTYKSVDDGNFVIIQTRAHNPKFLLYNTRRHCFVNVDGCIRFNYFDSWQLENGIKNGFYMVKQSGRQLALIDFQTNQPLKLPNGSSWMEGIEFSSNVHNWYNEGTSTRAVDTSKTNLIHCIYDSSSGEEYYYDTKTRSFIQPEKYAPSYLFGGNDIKPYLPYCDSNPYGIYMFGYRNDDISIEQTFKEGKPFKIDGTDVFNKIEYCGKGIFNCYASQHFLYDITTNQKYLFPEIDNIVGIGSGAGVYYGNKEEGRYIYFRVYTEQQAKERRDVGFRSSGGDYIIVFSLESKQWMKNPIDGTYVFSLYGANEQKGTMQIYFAERHANMPNKMQLCDIILNNDIENQAFVLEYPDDYKEKRKEYEDYLEWQRKYNEWKGNQGNVAENKQHTKLFITEADIKSMVKKCIENILLK